MACFQVKENARIVPYLLFLAKQDEEKKVFTHACTHKCMIM